jgi:hypothetical protein
MGLMQRLPCRRRARASLRSRTARHAALHTRCVALAEGAGLIVLRHSLHRRGMRRSVPFPARPRWLTISPVVGSRLRGHVAHELPAGWLRLRSPLKLRYQAAAELCQTSFTEGLRCSSIAERASVRASRRSRYSGQQGNSQCRS